MTRVAVAVVLLLVALGLPPSAFAHARMLRTEPSSGAVLARAPAAVRVVFDDAVRAGRRVAAIRNGGGSVLAGAPRVVSDGRVLEIPLRRSLGDGDYTVRWDAISDDGHELAGVIAFGVGAGRAPPEPALSAGAGVKPRDVASRWFFFGGLLAAAGAVIFRLVVWRRALTAVPQQAEGRALAEQEELRTGSAVLFVALLLAFLGALGAAPAGGTRYALWIDVAIVLAAVGAALAALASITLEPLLWIPAAALALTLVSIPTLSGHALDAGQSFLAPFVDVLHVLSAAVWLGALLSLALVTPRAARALGHGDRRALYGAIAPRTSEVILVSVVVLAGTGVVRAVGELSSVDELWTTGYGRTLLVKTAVFAALLVAGWQNRYRLVPGLARAARGVGSLDAGRLFALLRRNVFAELAGFVMLVSAVAFLTDLPPGGRASPAPAREVVPVATPRAAVRAPAPPTAALVAAGQARDLAVGLAVTPVGRGRLALTVTVLGQNGGGVPGLTVALGVDGPADTPAPACGPGCYSALVARRGAGAPRFVSARLEGRNRPPESVVFRLSERWPPPPAGSIVRRAAGTFRSLSSVSVLDSIESRPGSRVVSLFRFRAPDRMSYAIRGGAQAVVIGPRRWDRPSRTAAWTASPQQPLSVPAPPWSSARDARVLRASVLGGRRVLVVSFLDPVGPAWFTIQVEPRTGRTLDVRMTAAAHFMHERYSGFDAPVEIRPPLGR
jgi:copper transport protein